MTGIAGGYLPPWLIAPTTAEVAGGRSRTGETYLSQVTTFPFGRSDAPCILSDISAIFLRRRVL